VSDLRAHALALLRAGRCPACAERLSARSLFRAAPCPRCETSVDPACGGAALAQTIQNRGRRHLLGVAVGVGVAHLLLGWMPLVGALVLLAATAWIRVGILQPASRLLSPKRRILTRWTARLLIGVTLALTLIATEALTLLPGLGLPIKAVLSAGEVALSAWAATRYVHWQVEREAHGQAIETWEWLVLGLALALLLAAVVALALAFIALISAFDSLAGWLR